MTTTLTAGRLAEALDLQAAEALADLDLLLAGVQELRDRLGTGLLDADSRADIADDLLQCSDRVLAFALVVAA